MLRKAPWLAALFSYKPASVSEQAAVLASAFRGSIRWWLSQLRVLAMVVCCCLLAIPPVNAQAPDATADSVQVHQLNAEHLQAQGKYRLAISEWRIALRLSPEDRNLQRQLAAALFLSQDYKGVLPELQRLLTGNPGSANLNFFVGDCLFETEQIDRAIPYLTTALKLNPNLMPAHISLGLCYSRLGKWTEAIPHLNSGLPLDRDGALYYQLARGYAATGNPDLSKTMMARYQEIQKQAGASGEAR